MLLKSLSLQGFKTFSDKIELSFNNGITVIVGPNGSGKSNISDAIRWVLGEQSIKTLRCSKMEDVIFNGTPTKKARGFAEVTLTIENIERKLPIDDNQVSITRRYHRSGESEYLINQNQVRLKDIHEIFMDTGLGRDGYSIISQGKIDSIVASKSEDRREIFEEAAGISRFRHRKADAEKRLDQAKENILRLNDIVTELKERIEPLKEQSEKAKTYLSLSEKKKELEIGIWIYVIEKSADMLKEHEEKISISKNQYDQVEQEIEKILSKNESNFLESNSCVAKIDESRRNISQLEEKFSVRQNKISVLENDIKHNNENINRIQNEIEESFRSSGKIDDEIANKNNIVENLRLSMIEKQNKLDMKTSELENLQLTMRNFSDSDNFLTNELSQLSIIESESKVKIIADESTAKELMSRVSKVDLDLVSLDKKISDMESTLNDYNDMENQSREKVQMFENSIGGYKIKLDLKKDKINKIKNLSDKLTLDCEDKIRRIRMLEELERNLEGFAQSVKAVMKEFERGILTGIHGPISRIIKVEELYSVAISTALGSAMQNVVVDNESDAKKAIIMLKRKEIGRATFLPISTIRGNKIFYEGLEKSSGFIGIASDLCNFDLQYTSIIISILGRTVVVENIDCAIEIAKKFGYKFKIVTLDGQVINAGGSLTGGTVVKGSNLLSRTVEIKKMIREHETLKSKAKDARTLLRSSQEEVSKIESSFLDMQSSLSEEKEELFKISTECKRFHLELNNTKLIYQSLEEEKSNSQNRIKKLLIDKKNEEIKLQSVLNKISEIKVNIKMNSSNKDELFSKKEVLGEAIQQMHLDIFSDEKDISSTEYEIKSMNERKKGSADRINLFNYEINHIKENNVNLEIEIKKLIDESSSLKSDIRKNEETIINFNKDRMRLEKLTTELRNQERERINDREIVSRELSKLEERKSNLQKEYDSIIAKLWDDYELTRSEACSKYNKVENEAKATICLGQIKNKIKSLGNINVAAIEEFQEVSQRYEFMSEQISDVEKSRDELKGLITELTQKMKELFVNKLSEINDNFKAAFKELFGGGDAKIMLSDPENILGSGIEIEVRPPGKIVNRLEALSGGERALIAISLYFSIMQVNPPPFCVLDEIEAALDDVNVYRFSSYLRKINNNTQFIAISHRRGTMEEADVLYGVTMQDEGVSKLLKLDAAEMEKKLNIR